MYTGWIPIHFGGQGANMMLNDLKVGAFTERIICEKQL